MTGYTDAILHYAADDSRVGTLQGADGTGEVGLNAGDVGNRLAVRFALRVRNGAVDTVRVQVFGCGFTIAACTAAAELAEGRSLEEVLAIDPATVDTALDGLPRERSYCAELAVEALHAAVMSARSEAHAVQATVTPVTQEEDHAPRVSTDDPVYRALTQSEPPAETSSEDRHLFACLLAVAARESRQPGEALGLTEKDVAGIMKTWFPALDPALLTRHAAPEPAAPPEVNDDVLGILLSHVPEARQGQPRSAALWLAHILAARAAHPGHLWTAMGLFKRPELTASIRRILPTLAAANGKGMRWKRYLFKQVCDLHGAVLCKSPNCGVCSDHSLCFAPEEG